MVTDLKEMMIERLNAFHSKSGRYPERILIYRDGVSEVSSKDFNLEIIQRVSSGTICLGYRGGITCCCRGMPSSQDEVSSQVDYCCLRTALVPKLSFVKNTHLAPGQASSYPILPHQRKRCR